MYLMNRTQGRGEAEARGALAFLLQILMNLQKTTCYVR